MKKIVFDLDGTICEEVPTFEKYLAKPRQNVVELVNTLFEDGHFIIIYTARSWAEYSITQRWLNDHKIKYSTLICGKPIYDIWVDDRCLHVDREWQLTSNISQKFKLRDPG